ncbi:hypothetical protein AGMMS49975_01500 [Clostridia bacterium]|nr:hypothetical protein AGMMS49975_01500 [Clostridia bacterium]
MGYFQEIGKLAFSVTGAVLGGGVSAVGSFAKIKTIEEIGENMYTMSKDSGRMLGQAVDGVFGIAHGALALDRGIASKGVSDLAQPAGAFIKRGAGIVKEAGAGVAGVCKGAIARDREQMASSAKDIAKAAAKVVL